MKTKNGKSERDGDIMTSREKYGKSLEFRKS